MKAKKFLLMFVLLLVATLSFGGCANVEMIRTVDSYYTIMDKFVITLDKNKLGGSYDSVRNAIHDDMITFRNYVHEWIDSFENDYPNVHEMLEDNILCQEVDGGDNVLSVSVEFYDVDSFALFYGLVGIDDGEPVEAMSDIGPFLSQVLLKDFQVEGLGMFLYKYAMVNNAGIMKGIEDFEIEGIGVNYYDKYTQLTGLDKDSINVSQVFAYPDDRLYSNADEIEIVDGFTFMAWDLSDKDENFEMSIYKLAPETVSWYILALLITISVVVLGYMVIMIRFNKKPRVEITKREVEKGE